jgi:hypothetical protein
MTLPAAGSSHFGARGESRPSLFFRAPGVEGGRKQKTMSTLISSVEHALAVAASDTVKVAKFDAIYRPTVGRRCSP